jgi:hypothetical protein
MVECSPWLNLPQTIVLMKANQIIAHRTAIALEPDADEEQRRAALIELRQARTAMGGNNLYVKAQQRIHQRLISGVATKARRTPAGPYENIDPVEYTGVELQEFDAIAKRTQTIVLFDLRINTVDFVEKLTGVRITPDRADLLQSSVEVEELSPRQVEKWDCTGDPLPKLIGWAQSRWSGDLHKLPNCLGLLQTFRGQFGRVSGINEKTMRDVRRQLAPREARRGGAPMHRR